MKFSNIPFGSDSCGKLNAWRPEISLTNSGLRPMAVVSIYSQLGVGRRTPPSTEFCDKARQNGPGQGDALACTFRTDASAGRGAYIDDAAHLLELGAEECGSTTPVWVAEPVWWSEFALVPGSRAGGSSDLRASAGPAHTILFDGRDRAGRPLPAGVWFVRLRTSGEEGGLRLVRVP
jgi:hypothetical protein